VVVHIKMAELVKCTAHENKQQCSTHSLF
jgi:hypothetical protein